jgi:hypothetical protein
MHDMTEAPAPIERLVRSAGVRSGYTSLVAHVAVLILLALCMIPAEHKARPRPIVITMTPATEPEADPGAAGGGAVEPLATDVVAVVPEVEAVSPSVESPEPLIPVEPPVEATVVPVPSPDPEPVLAATEAFRPMRVPAVAASHAVSHGPAPGSRVAEAYAGRRGPTRGRGAFERGGSAASEEAVERGLAWLARHQAADGSWRFDLAGCQCDGACRDRGTVTSTTAATGIALLPFLGAGHTHVEGTYRETVTRGIYYLMSRLQPTSRGGDLSEGTMYGHGVATLALAEALGMTSDDALVKYVRDAVRFMETAQDQHGGGWRYLPGQPGDTTVTAWQLAALRSAALAGVAVPSPTMDGICRFLDRVQVRRGEAYGYQSPQARPCTSAVGLACRVYTGWPEHEILDRGLTVLAKGGPDSDAIYLNFYLAQALLHRDHPLWPRWNARNRDQLVARQSTVGHEAGSWFLTDHDTAPGGRLAHTALAVLTLEVYYRLLPIYRPDAAAAGW